MYFLFSDFTRANDIIHVTVRRPVICEQNFEGCATNEDSWDCHLAELNAEALSVNVHTLNNAVLLSEYRIPVARSTR